MDSRDWFDLASVYEAGASNHGRYALNVERQQQAEALRAMAARCREIGQERAAEAAAE